MNKKWIVAEKKSNDLIEQLLINREIPVSKREIFLNPNYEIDLHNPRLLNDAEKAACRILEAIDKKEKIGIFTDYDADGVPGAALLTDILFQLGLDKEKLVCYIPDREEGYGLNEKSINFFIEQEVNLLITIDAGITAKEAVRLANNKKIEVIITDHHEVREDLVPDAFAIINPKLSPNYPFSEICGCAVIFKICQLMAEISGRISDDKLKWQLDLVAISTICDIVPLVDENRVLVKFGLLVLQKTKRVGLKKLFEAAVIEQSKIDTYVVGFLIGPRLNAAGRLGSNKIAYDLLTCQDEEEAKKIAAKLNKINSERQEILNQALIEAIEKVQNGKLHEKKVIVVSDEKWQAGIVGLVASKLVEKFSRPAIVFNQQGDDLTGSARSIDGLHLVEVLEELGDNLTRFGGHKKAAGLSLKTASYENFYQKILYIAEEKLEVEDLLPKIKIDTRLNICDVKDDLFSKIKKLEPFGLGNPKPVFLAEKVQVTDYRRVGKLNEHLSLKLASKVDGRLTTISAIGFKMGDYQTSAGEIIDLVYQIDEDNWNGRKTLKLKIIDFKKSQ